MSCRASTLTARSHSPSPPKRTRHCPHHSPKPRRHHPHGPADTELEASLFTKLSWAYTVNSAAIPLFVGAIFSWSLAGDSITQSWYEPGGVLSYAWLLMLINAVAKDLLKIFRPIERFRRSWVGRGTHSQLRLNRLWRPPFFHIGQCRR